MVVIYKCPGCGAPMVFDPESQKLTCEHCQTELTVEEYEQKYGSLCSGMSRRIRRRKSPGSRWKRRKRGSGCSLRAAPTWRSRSTTAPPAGRSW